MQKLKIGKPIEVGKHTIMDWVSKNTWGDPYFDISEWCENDADIFENAAKLIRKQLKEKNKKKK